MPQAADSPSKPAPAPTDQPSRWRPTRVVATGSLALAFTAPGQTAGLSVLIDPIIEELQVGRSAVSTAYLIGTLTGAFAMPAVGRAIDRYGPRRIMTAVGVAFGSVLLAASLVSNIVGLTAAFIGLRMVGQGSLSLVATTAVAIYVEKRRGLAQGLTSAFGAAGISLSPVLLESFAATHSFRTVWLLEGIVILAVVVPLALFGLPRRSPLDAQRASAKAAGGGTTTAPGDWTVRQATRTGLFWVVTASIAAVGMLGTAVNFHQIALLGERGLTPTEAAANFIPQTVAGLGATVLMGMLVDKVSPRVVMVACMGALALALASGGFVQPGWSALGFGFLLGIAGNGLRVLEATIFPATFGLSHVGAIRGVVVSVGVGASAIGPLALSVGQDWLGSYRPVLLIVAVIPVAVALAAAVVRTPQARTRRHPNRSDLGDGEADTRELTGGHGNRPHADRPHGGPDDTVR